MQWDCLVLGRLHTCMALAALKLHHQISTLSCAYGIDYIHLLSVRTQAVRVRSFSKPAFTYLQANAFSK